MADTSPRPPSHRPPSHRVSCHRGGGGFCRVARDLKRCRAENSVGPGILFDRNSFERNHLSVMRGALDRYGREDLWLYHLYPRQAGCQDVGGLFQRGKCPVVRWNNHLEIKEFLGRPCGLSHVHGEIAACR
jgi:hypothetical protein